LVVNVVKRWERYIVSSSLEVSPLCDLFAVDEILREAASQGSFVVPFTMDSMQDAIYKMVLGVDTMLIPEPPSFEAVPPSLMKIALFR